jgi:hypothetical protein
MSECRHLTIFREKEEEEEKYYSRDWGHPTSVFFKRILEKISMWLPIIENIKEMAIGFFEFSESILITWLKLKAAFRLLS